MNSISMGIRSILRPIMLKCYWQWMNVKRGHKVQAWNVGLRTRIGKHAIVRKGVEIGPQVELGEYSYISGPRSVVESAKIGKFCSIARQTVIGLGNHQYRHVTSHPFPVSPEFGGLVSVELETPQSEATVIGNDVWIGINSIVMRGVRIGDGAVVGANSVVTHNVEPYTIVCGIPARYLAHRFPAVVAAAIQSSQWWNWPHEVLAERVVDFADPVAFATKYGGYTGPSDLTAVL